MRVSLWKKYKQEKACARGEMGKKEGFGTRNEKLRGLDI